MFVAYEQVPSDVGIRKAVSSVEAKYKSRWLACWYRQVWTLMKQWVPSRNIEVKCGCSWPMC
jgi:hypothetical protein